MNKPIIIDGVDVSECASFDENTTKCIDHYGTDERDFLYCKDFCNCYFKQLQRLKAENEELKEEYKYFKHISVGEVHRLRKALAEVQEIAYTTDFDIRDIQEIVNEVLRLEQENEKLKNDKKIILKNGSTISKLCSQYRKALEKIQNVLFPKNKLLITDCKGLLKTQEILNEVLKDENH